MGYGRERKKYVVGIQSKSLSNPMTRCVLGQTKLWTLEIKRAIYSTSFIMTIDLFTITNSLLPLYIHRYYAILHISNNSTNISLIGIGLYSAGSSRQLSSIFM